jgi:hypothetical protein
MNKKLWLLIVLGLVLAFDVYRYRNWFWPKPEESWTPPRSEGPAFTPTRDETFRLLKERKFDQLEALASKHRGRNVKLGECDLLTLETFYSYFDFNSSTPDDYWESIASQLEEWAKAYPESPTPLVALGDLYINFGWHARGHGYADSVTQQGWKLFDERFRKAQRYLEQAADLRIQDPCTYQELIRVALGLGSLSRDYMEQAYERGVALEPNFVSTYRAKANYLLPRWYGAPGEWEAWLKKAADDRGGKEGDIIYAWVAGAVARTEYEDFFHKTAADYPRMRRGFEAALGLDGKNNYDANLNYLGFFACIAGDRDTAKNCFERMAGHWMQSIWVSSAYFNRCRAWATDPILNANPGPNPYAVR